MDQIKINHGLHKFKLIFENKAIDDPLFRKGLRNDVNVKLWMVYTVNGEPQIKTFNSIFYRIEPREKNIGQKLKFWRILENKTRSNGTIYESGNVIIDNREEIFLMIMMEIPNRELVSVAISRPLLK